LARGIRLRYTGLVAFVSQVFSVFASLAFLVFLTRSVTVVDFGVWGYIMLIISFVFFPNNIASYWIPRYIARGVNVSKTGLAINLIMSLFGLAIFLVISPYLAKKVNTDLLYFMVASSIIPFMYLSSSLQSIAQGCAPQTVGYGNIASETARVILGFITMIRMKAGLYGAFISVAISQLVFAIFLLASLRNHVTEGNVDFGTARKWSKMGWIPIYSNLAATLIGADAFIVTLLASSTQPIAFWNAALAIAGVVGYSTQLSFALYPKLLSGGDARDVETSFKLVLMFAVPSAVGALILAEPLLKVLGYKFVEAATILRLSTLTALLGCIIGVLGSVIIGTEKVDIEDASFKKLLRSRLFLLPTLSYVQALIYLPALSIASAIIINLSLKPIYINVPLACTLIGLFSTIPIFIYEYRLAKRILPFQFPVKSLAKYCLASIVLGVFMLFYPKNVVETIASVFVGGLAYFLVLFIIDRDARQLTNSIISKIKTSLRRGNVQSGAQMKSARK
jgi:hypothetical protein